VIPTQGATLTLVFLLSASTLPAASVADQRDFFEMRVRPVLAKNCFTCHTAARMGGLEMSGREALLKGGKSGPAIVPGDAEKSLLVQAVAQTHERLKMPPQGKLAETEIADLRAWIKDGAIWPESAPNQSAKAAEYVITPEQRAYWAFQPVRKPDPPAVKDKNWARSAIDRFILAKLEAKNLKPVRMAGKPALIRRATFDLIGLPPTPEEVDAFVRDTSKDAFAKVVDRLLASPHYGERWGRYWLDVARYSDDKLNSTMDEPYANSFRYRDWVIGAFNQDLPYDLFVKAQIAGDQLPEKDPEKYQPGLAFYADSPEFQDDRVDVTSRGFLGLTVACATCHDHKFDPIPTKDYYSLLGIFRGTEYHEVPLAPEDVVAAFQKHKKLVDDQEAAIKAFLEAQATQLSEILAAKTARYLKAAEKGVSTEDGLDAETLERWTKYLKKPQKEHHYLPAKDPQEFQAFVLAVNAEKKHIDDENHIRLGGSNARRDLSNANLLSLERDKYFLWRDLFSETGILYYGDKKIDRFLQGEWKSHLDSMRATLADLKKTMPPQYPFLQTIRDVKNPGNMRVLLRGSPDSPGEEAPRRFLAILSPADRKPFSKGSGRLELAEAIADPNNPLTARVMVNRIWQRHFGQGIVRTPSNFGQLGDRPSHPELLDYLAARFVENKWSIKSLHREIMLSSAYALSSENSAADYAADPENRLVWRANRRRLDAEALRDSLLYVSGNLDLKPGGKAERLTDEYKRRAVYGFVSRRKLDGMLALFDFPSPNNTSEQRLSTSVPLQKLFFMNSPLVADQAKALAARLKGEDTARIGEAYRILFSRPPSKQEIDLGQQFLHQGKDPWPQYAQVLLSSNEFSFIQ
jgi:mono/diheme cytochrome c family protein